MKPDIAMLGNWLLSWVQQDGAIHGFHNHSVWGSNPFRWSDFTCGHSTWASPLLPALSLAIQDDHDCKLEETLLRLLHFQTSRFQDDDQYAHIGFQMGESLKIGLIHNMMPNVSLGLTAWYGRTWLSSEAVESIRAAIIRSMEACDRIYPFENAEINICNQEYARLWGKLLYRKAFGEERSGTRLKEQLDFMIEHFHVRGFPDSNSEGTYRYLGDHTTLEPAEYYGLVIAPLVLAYEIYGEERYLEHAGAVCRHLVRSSWYDARGQRRLHRTWTFSGSHWKKMNTPMLIAGMGMSLYGIHRYLEHQKDSELADFLHDCERTYAFYQNPRGYFASATGWQSEVDVAPSSAWHAHDFFYLLIRHGASSSFPEQIHSNYRKTSVLLGDQCMWVERGQQWTITDYFWQDVFKLLGRKDQSSFGRDMDWVGGDRALPEHFSFPDRPMFIKTDEGIFLKSAHDQELDISSIANSPYLGVLK